MKRFGLALAALFAALAFAAPLTASAADKPEPYSKDQISRGMKEAPGMLQTAAVPCTVTNAAFIGEGEGKPADDPKGKSVKVTSYEVACQQSLGYIIQNFAGVGPKAYDCLALAASKSACRLPENADPKTGLTPIIAQVGAQCAISDARYLGSKPTGEIYYEVACGAAPGFILETAKSAPPRMIGCDQIGGALSCKFTTQAQLDAAANAKAAALLASSGKTCQMTKARTIGVLQSGDYAYEVACQDGTGYVLEANNAGAFHQAFSCAAVGDACKLTDATKAESAENGTYTRLSKAGGHNCDVAKYRYIGMQGNNEVVELQCSNRPDGVFGVFPSDDKSPAKFYDCISAGALGQSCKLSSAAPLYPKYTQALAAKGKKTCQVSGAQWLARTTSGDTYVETACADGLPGWVLEMTPAGTAAQVLTCGEVKSSGVTCSLPGNAK